MSIKCFSNPNKSSSGETYSLTPSKIHLIEKDCTVTPVQSEWDSFEVNNKRDYFWKPLFFESVKSKVIV